MSRGSSSGKGLGTGRGRKGGGGGRRDLPLCGRGLMVLNPIQNQWMSFQLRVKVNLTKTILLEDTINETKD